MLRVRLGPKGMLWLVGASVQTSQTLSVSAGRLFYVLIIRVFAGVALAVSYKIVSFAFITGLTGSRGQAFGLSWVSTGVPHEAYSFLVLMGSERCVTLPFI